jgi:alanyl-tRNA synthetase
MSSASDVRQAFLDYFAKNGHSVVESSPLVPRNDPTLMFTNAGMVQFKNVFTGQEKRPYTRATTSQKCVRAGGKHNDLDNVGYTARHHTFFEMLGNFSFGDYFKDDAIPLAWNLITKDYGLPRDKLWVTVYHDDDQAFDIWKKIGVPESRIVRIATSDNFWAMGDTGPCGPCSEIFYDHGDKIWGGPPGTPEADGDRYIEIWNLVFMQFEQVTKEQRVSLPKPSIDTGMGLERITAVMQGKHDNYDIDLMRALIEASADASSTDPDGAHKVSHRVVADHLRSSCFLIADGVLPSNEGRGYVLRRIMRRAMRHAQLMGCKEPLMHRLVPTLVSEMGRAYPELGRAEALIAETLKLEETRFKQTLDRGLRLLDEATGSMSKGDRLPGETAFKLYDTFGFPLDLTQDALRPRGIEVDTDGFQTAMAAQKAEARKAWAGSGEAATEKVWFEIREDKGATEFLGYDTQSAEGRIDAIVVGGQPVNEAKTGTEVAIVLNQTPFYGESGGQQGDSGVITTAGGAKVEITDTQKKLGALHAHLGKVVEGTLKVDDMAILTVDATRRGAIASNHSATHLLHAALRRKLGDHVTQKGSLVSPDRFRFDISHPKPISAEEASAVEAEVNAMIRQNDAVTTRLMTPDEAIKAGAMALFGEKYGDEVRVLSMGKLDDGGDYSVELCGGTHVKRTGDIALFKIVGEGAVAAGVRRIEALTGEAARHYFLEQEGMLQAAADVLKAQPKEVPQRITTLIEERRKLERELSELRKQLATGGGSGGPQVKDVNGVKYAARSLDGVPAKDLRGMVDAIKKEIGSGVVALTSVADGKVSVVVGVSNDLTSKINAAELVKIATPLIGGQGGGGRPDFAQGGGADPSGAAKALEAIAEQIGKAA